MGLAQIAGAILQLILLFVKRWLESDDEKKKKAKQLSEELHGAIKAGDSQAINLIISRIKRI